MEHKHIIHVAIDESSLEKTNNYPLEYTVDVYWEVNFNPELYKFFNKRKYVHDLDLLKEGVGRLTILFKMSESDSPTNTLAYIESLAAKHIVSNSGINAFGFSSDAMSIRRDQLHFALSQSGTVKLLMRGKDNAEYLERMAALSAKSGPAAGYLYGCTASVDEYWLSELKSRSFTIEYHHRSFDIDIRENDYVFTPQGDIIIDFRTVEEFMNNENTQYMMRVKGNIYPRPFDTVYEIIKSSESIIYNDNAYLDKVRRIFGDDCFLLYNELQYCYIPIKKLNSNQFTAMGYRKYINPLRLEEMHGLGIGLHFKQKLTKDELEELRKQYESQPYPYRG
ncbi:hypothetical protein M3923_002866 [Vibrio metschnikovii]|uniref:hypothetical protein n=1 Tax=Vibrio metschnikovii TaxID=28172 RepID=UPI001C2F5271|nr:hypothetical protein [Vibrio metschnikovii]EKO3674171.1 hypothetical protein [Vibrio metschnikovii]